MRKFIIRRMLFMIPTLLLISIVSFAVIQAPPGDFLTAYVASLMEMGDAIDPARLAALEERFGLGQPIHVQYLRWMGGEYCGVI